ncbi:MAG: DsbA family protein [Candidatus Aenigmarchaeota archaeon]|nr:DsbA family protein [Candidatus Aenigmarchaeota archaeon]
MEKKVCEECGKKFDNDESLNQHKQAKHSAENKETGKPTGKSRNYLGIGTAIIIILAVVAAGAFLMTGTPKYVPKEYVPHIIGPDNATVEIVEFSDFQCPYCKAVEPTVKEVLDAYDGKIRFVYKHFPLASHEFGQKAAEASECAADIGGNDKFWEYHDSLFTNQKKLNIPFMKSLAKDMGLNTTAFDACFDSGAMTERVQNNTNEGKKLGVTGTPTFFINGEVLSGSQPSYKFKEIIDRKL